MKVIGINKRGSLDLDGQRIDILVEVIETEDKITGSIEFHDLSAVHATETRVQITGLVLRRVAETLMTESLAKEKAQS